ncbi:MAG: hypothetical protein QF779_03105 [SAR324 cluster bacterium]|nr:hypothetical protein [SAR324 cluster bacterium]
MVLHLSLVDESFNTLSQVFFHHVASRDFTGKDGGNSHGRLGMEVGVLFGGCLTVNKMPVIRINTICQ